MPISWLKNLRRWWDQGGEQGKLFKARWAQLPAQLRRPQQFIGVNSVACGATHSIMEKCNFACTSCYLTEAANYTRPLPFAQVKEQLDVLRRHLGKGGKVQITSGEVTLLPVEKLGPIVAYARAIGLDPMVMSNGQRLLQVPDYLPRLVREYGLEKISFHIDTTQKGRPGMALGLTERQLHPLRDRFARLVRQVRRQTGRRLHAAQTVTVTEQNFSGIPDIVDWALGQADSFRILSFLPVAQVGRTKDRGVPTLDMGQVWAQVCAGAGQRLNREAMLFGHPECNITAPLLVFSFGGQRRVVEVVRSGKRWDARVFGKLVRHFSGGVDLNQGLAANLLGLVRPGLARPQFIAELALYGIYRLLGWGGWGLRFGLLGLVGRARVRPLLIVVHKFMDAAELDTPLGQERLAACAFKLPVEGELVSMCQMNATSLRGQLNRAQLNRALPADR